MTAQPGRVVLFGSGEISAGAQPIYEDVMRDLDAPVHVSVLETPAGFQLNSAQVAGAVAEYLEEHLQNYKPDVTVIPARKRGTRFSPDHADIVRPMLTSNCLFLGPGSPTYAVRQLADTLAWQVLLARQRLGHPIIMASAATIASSAWALPVYEIYKVGDDVHWNPGLNLWGAYGLSLVFVPHWNNNEGGEKHDTSRCFMGRPRFREMLGLLPKDTTVVGIDEHTALSMDPGAGRGTVMGRGGVTLLREGGRERFETGSGFDLAKLGSLHLPALGEGIDDAVFQMIDAAEREAEAAGRPPEHVLALVADRQEARSQKDWAAADRLRDEIAALGWTLRDTGDGPELVRGE